MFAALCDLLGRASCVCDKLPSAEMSEASGNGACFFKASSSNAMLVCLRLRDGARAAFIAPEDVCVTVFGADTVPLSVRTQARLASSGCICIEYALVDALAMAPKRLRVCVHACGVPVLDARIPVEFNGRTGGHQCGQHVIEGCYHIAVHPAGTHLAAAIYAHDAVFVYALPDMQRVAILGGRGTGPGVFQFPRGLCFVDDGSILVCDYENSRVQHLTLDGTWVATYEVQLPRCIALHGDALVIGSCQSAGVHVLSLRSHAQQHRWLIGVSVFAVTFVNATTLAITTHSPNTLATITLRTLDGVMTRLIASGILACGLAVSTDGCLLVSDYNRARVGVYLPDGDELVETPFAAHASEEIPHAIAIHAARAYVCTVHRFAFTSTICVFE